jgi:hypothetical protein
LMSDNGWPDAKFVTVDPAQRPLQCLPAAGNVMVLGSRSVALLVRPLVGRGARGWLIELPGLRDYEGTYTRPLILTDTMLPEIPDVPIGFGPLDEPMTARDSGQAMQGEPAHPTPPQYVLSKWQWNGDVNSLSSAKVTSRSIVPYPPGTRPVAGLLPSRDRTRLLWWCEPFIAPSTPAIQRWIYTHLRARASASHRSLWSSDSVGSRMREIGFLTLDSGEEPGFTSAWLPDGKHVSFVHRDVLYIVPTG